MLMDFPNWFEQHYRDRGKDESPSRAIQRLALESGVGWTTVLRATKGTKLQRGSAIVLAGMTGGRVSVESLLGAPTRVQKAAATGTDGA